MSTVQTLYPVGTVTISISPQNVAGSATYVAGVESDSISNVSNLDIDHLVSGVWQNGASVGTGESLVQIWVVPCLTDDLSSSVSWPDVFDGTASAETVTSAGILAGCGRLGAAIQIDGPSANQSYYCADFSIAALFGGTMPTRYVLFMTHNNLASNSNSSAGGFVWQYQRLRATVA